MSRTNEEAGAADLFDPFGIGKAWRESSLEPWSKAMIDFVNSEAYAHASAQWLDSYLSVSQSFQQVTDRAMTETLSRCHLPSTADVDRLAERLTHIELRLDDLDARLDEVLRLLKCVADAAAATTQAVEKTERAVERAEQTAGEAKQAAEHAAQAVERVSAAATPPKNNANGPAARPTESQESVDAKRQERK